jgi:hypothetical protein
MDANRAKLSPDRFEELLANEDRVGNQARIFAGHAKLGINEMWTELHRQTSIQQGHAKAAQRSL